MPAPTQTSCHLFCTVIDNYGDLGVCWRLARHLADKHALAVTLWVDDLDSFQRLAPDIDPAQSSQMLDKLCIRHWQGDCVDIAPGDLVIEGFACSLPADYIRAMGARSSPPVWINLEYLSAESWVEGCHGLTSVHPGTGLIKHFWFPGFSTGTGGLLRTATELERIWTANAQSRACRHISLFGYEQAGIASLLDALAGDKQPSVLNVFAGRSLPDVARWVGHDLVSGDEFSQGALTLRVLPLLPHTAYDQLLASSDLNLVRGEDSFVRAQWAGEAMLWHIYPQDEDTHLIKLAAWQQRVETVAAAANTPMPASWGQMLMAWNLPPTQANSCQPEDWRRFFAELPEIRAALQSWRQHLLAQQDLATQLMRFYADRVESLPK